MENYVHIFLMTSFLCACRCKDVHNICWHHPVKYCYGLDVHRNWRHHCLVHIKWWHHPRVHMNWWHHYLVHMNWWHHQTADVRGAPAEFNNASTVTASWAVPFSSRIHETAQICSCNQNELCVKFKSNGNTFFKTGCWKCGALNSWKWSDDSR